MCKHKLNKTQIKIKIKVRKKRKSLKTKDAPILIRELC